ncbi:unnamed protein product [Angiostrongylus costaricensis]|uniref:Retrotrans_gag domain-containing protein n=1 Tax=Angiostrongylus costaricensis TaxID=334426 RepID=A0A0R3PUR6_ANGCS|nr:unnamed protein product [Angiostrongylus costaricensis]
MNLTDGLAARRPDRGNPGAAPPTSRRPAPSGSPAAGSEPAIVWCTPRPPHCTRPARLRFVIVARLELRSPTRPSRFRLSTAHTDRTTDLWAALTDHRARAVTRFLGFSDSIQQLLATNEVREATNK